MIALADLWIAVLCGVLVAAITSLILTLPAPFIREPLRRVAPSMRTTILTGLLAAPLATGLLTAALVAVSTHALPFDLVSHHCHIDGAACVSHAPAEETLLLTALGGGSLGTILVWLVLSVFDLASRSHQSRRLLRLASARGDDGVNVLQTSKPIAVSAGLFTSETFISDGLVRSLSKQQLEVIKAHETAHAVRRDGLLRLIGNTLSIGHLPWTLNLLTHELELAQEQACDAEAATAHGAIPTVETLLAVERQKQALGGQTPDVCLAFAAADIEVRVRALLAPRFIATHQSAAVFASGLIASALCLFIASEPVHHTLESFFLPRHH
ncbi:hypothetical protein D1224_10815 [Henriciella barbarensis]|uniref:Peptidase M48 domain-containing protein n=1 Tax=Henriciella barbarensis TaxID=86342 RepID=A0A399QUF1_9PROT|nr:M56 family metallopeptidase [Henriciella barbarensis]RIJ22478.1 hypothetical protein D1224_10815 [Henriciella barbarensis]